MTAYGHIVGGSPDPDFHGAVLTADVALDDTVLHVSDTGDFDELAATVGGQVMIGLDLTDVGDPASSTLLPYDTCDEDELTVTLSAPSTAEASAGDIVYVYDPATGTPVTDYTVWVRIDGADQSGDPIPVTMAHGLIDSLADTADMNGQAVELEEDEDGELQVVNVLGSSRTEPIRAMQDSASAAGTGDKTVDLTFVPMVNSEHVYWNGVYQHGSQWTRDGRTITVQDPDNVIEFGDDLTVEYLYRDNAQPPPVPSSVFLVGITQNEPGFGADTLDFPDGTQPGDYAVLMLAQSGFWDLDPILLDDGDGHRRFGEGIDPTHNGFEAYWIGAGKLGSDLSPLPVICSSLTGDQSATLAVYRTTGTVTSPLYDSGGFPDLTYQKECRPQIADPAHADSKAIVGLCVSNSLSGGDDVVDEHGDWTADGSIGHTASQTRSFYNTDGIAHDPHFWTAVTHTELGRWVSVTLVVN